MNRSPGPTLLYLKKLGRTVPRFASFKTTSTTSKMWVLPDGSVVPLDCFHYQWLLQNKERVQAIGLEVDTVAPEEQPLRLAALRFGFRRVNYEHPKGRLTVEANEQLWDDRATDAVFMVVLMNLEHIDTFSLNLFTNEDAVIYSASQPLFGFDDIEKLQHLPTISDSARGIALRRIASRLLNFGRSPKL